MGNLTPKEKKLLRNQEWRLDNLYKIKDKNQKIIKLKRNAIQRRLHDDCTGFDVVLKPRQVGISSYFLIKKLDKCIFTRNYTAAIISHDRESMEKLFAIIRRAHKHMNEKVKPEIDKGGGSKYELRFPTNDSKITCTLEAVSETVNDLHISEMALMKNAERVKTSMDAVPISNGIISIETTCRGFNFFHKFWNDKDSIFARHFFPWYLHEEYFIESEKFKLNKEELKIKKYAKKTYGVDITYNQFAFRRFKINQKDGDIDNFSQEYPSDPATCFIASGQSFFDLRIISRIKEDLPKAPTDGGELEIYKTFEKGHSYVCGADTAEGVGGDFSVATIIDADTMEQVAQLRGQFKPSIFAEKIQELCRLYYIGSTTWPYLAVERNNHGHAVILSLVEIQKYENQYKHKDGREGWVTDKVTRPIMFNTLKDGLENQTLKVNSHDLINECLTFINNSGKMEASDNSHDDTVIAIAIALQMAIQFKSNNYDNIDRRILI